MTKEIINDIYYITSKDLKEDSGKGAFGRIYKCRSKKKFEEDMIFAAKKLFPNNNATLDYIDDEVKILKLIKEKKIPNVIQFYAFVDNRDDKPSHVYIVTEYCSGGTLQELINKNGALSEVDIYNIILPIVEAMAQFHGLGLIHRDIKCENIMFKEPWDFDKPEPKNVRIIDFGVSAQAKKFESTIGTCLEMAPEIFLKDECDLFVDVYSFGAVLYKMIFGTTLVNPSTCGNWFYNDAILRFPRCCFLSVEFFDLLQRCLCKHSYHRISFKEMLKHDFFKKKGIGSPFYEMFDGSKELNYISMIGERYDYIKMLKEKEEKKKKHGAYKNPFYKCNKMVLESIIKENNN